MEEEESRLQMDLTEEDIVQLKNTIEFHIKHWPGYPAAEIDEQPRLWRLRYLFNAACFEIQYMSGEE